MKQYTQGEKIIFSVGAVVLVTIVYGISGFKKSRYIDVKPQSNQINYQMGHAKSKSTLYSLNGREMDYQSEGQSITQTAKASQIEPSKDKKQVATKQTAQKQQEQALKQKKLSKAAVKAQAQMKFTQRADQKNVNKKQNEAQEDKLNTSYAANSAQDKNSDIAPSESNKKSYEQWRSELFAAQNREVIQGLVSAYKKNEVSSDEFYKLVSEMLNSKDDKMIGLGIYALRATPSYSSYLLLVKLEGHVNSNYDSYIKETLMSYHKSGLGVLKQALASGDQAVVQRTLEVVKSGLTYIKAGTVSILGDIRDTRGSLDAQYSVSNYNSFLPLLKNLTDDQYSGEISSLATQVMALIGDGSYVASNP